MSTVWSSLVTELNWDQRAETGLMVWDHVQAHRLLEVCYIFWSQSVPVRDVAGNLFTINCGETLFLTVIIVVFRDTVNTEQLFCLHQQFDSVQTRRSSFLLLTGRITREAGQISPDPTSLLRTFYINLSCQHTEEQQLTGLNVLCCCLLLMCLL